MEIVKKIGLFYSTSLSLSLSLSRLIFSQPFLLSHSHSQPLLASFLTHSQPLFLSLDVEWWVVVRWIGELCQGGSVVGEPSH